MKHYSRHASRAVLSLLPFPALDSPPSRRVMTRLNDDTAITRTETCQNTSQRRHGQDEVRDVSRHVSNMPGMRLQGPNDETGFRRLCPWYVFFTFSCLISSPKLETRVSSCFFYFLFPTLPPQDVSATRLVYLFPSFTTRARDMLFLNYTMNEQQRGFRKKKGATKGVVSFFILHHT